MTRPIVDEARERRACAAAMLEGGIDEAALNQWDLGQVQNASLDSFMEGWLARAQQDALPRWIPVEALELDFGDYCTIEQKRYGCANEHYTHKVVGALRSNAWVEVPVDSAKHGLDEVIHGEMEDVVRAICCGVSETEVRKYRVKDIRRSGAQWLAPKPPGETP